MPKKNDVNFLELSFNEFLLGIDEDLEKCKTQKGFEKCIDKLEQYKSNLNIENGLYKQSLIEMIDSIVEDIKSKF